MTTLLHPAPATNAYCAPCAWSALTGWSSETWPEKPMFDAEEYGMLERLRWEQHAPFYLDDMPDRLAGVSLQAFDEPGRWALTVEWDRDEGARAVTIAVAGADRVLAGNHILSSVRR